MASPPKYDLFISYAHADKTWVKGFVRKLLTAAESGYSDEKLRLFYDDSSTPAGSSLQGEIGRALANSAVCVPILSPQYIDSVESGGGCRQEWDIATRIHWDKTRCGVPFIVPVVMDADACRPPYDVGKYISFAGLNPAARKTDTVAEFKRNLMALLDSIEQQITAFRRGRLRAVAVGTRKGGVGKTTLTVALAERIASPLKHGRRTVRTGRRVLVVDADSQANATTLLIGAERAAEANQRRATLYDFTRQVLMGENPSVERCVITEDVGSLRDTAGNLWLLPSSSRFLDFESQPYRRDGIEHKDLLSNKKRFREGLRRWAMTNEVSVMLIDTGPNQSWVTRMFLDLADTYIVPVTPDAMALAMAEEFTRQVLDPTKGMRQDKRIEAIVANRYRGGWHAQQRSYLMQAKLLADSKQASFFQFADDLNLLKVGTNPQGRFPSFTARFVSGNHNAAAKELKRLADQILDGSP